MFGLLQDDRIQWLKYCLCAIPLLLSVSPLLAADYPSFQLLVDQAKAGSTLAPPSWDLFGPRDH